MSLYRINNIVEIIKKVKKKTFMFKISEKKYVSFEL